MLNEKTKQKIHSADKKLNVFYGWENNPVSSQIEDLLQFGSVEVGYRTQCGKMHITQKVYSEFNKIIKEMQKSGFIIAIYVQKHKNAYATLNQGFWNSSIYKLTNEDHT